MKQCTQRTHSSPRPFFDSQASSTVIGNIMLVALTLLIGGIVAMQAMRFMDLIDLSDSAIGREPKDIDVGYSIIHIDNNLTITIESISEEIAIDRVNYELYDVTLKRNEVDGYLLDIEGANDTKIRYTDADSNGQFSVGDRFFMYIGNGTLENDYILRLTHNRHPDVVYEVSIKEEDIKRD